MRACIATRCLCCILTRYRKLREQSRHISKLDRHRARFAHLHASLRSTSSSAAPLAIGFAPAPVPAAQAALMAWLRGATLPGIAVGRDPSTRGSGLFAPIACPATGGEHPFADAPEGVPLPPPTRSLRVAVEELPSLLVRGGLSTASRPKCF